MQDDLDEQTVEALARAAGLDAAWEAHREDVLAAARRARALHRAMTAPGDPADDPRAMHVGPAP
jgi:hypothetical protein